MPTYVCIQAAGLHEGHSVHTDATHLGPSVGARILQRSHVSVTISDFMDQEGKETRS